jgi:hypothetical protein
MAVISGRGGAAIPGETSELFSSVFLPLGTRATDVNGNEYIFVDFGAAPSATGFVYGSWVQFDHNFLATILTTTARGWVGIVTSGSAGQTVSATLRYGWVQIYGIHTGALGTSGVTTADGLIAVVTTDVGYVDKSTSTETSNFALFNALARTAPNTCASTATGTSALVAPFTAQLNYPFMAGWFGSTS